MSIEIGQLKHRPRCSLMGEIQLSGGNSYRRDIAVEGGVNRAVSRVVRRAVSRVVRRAVSRAVNRVVNRTVDYSRTLEL